MTGESEPQGSTDEEEEREPDRAGGEDDGTGGFDLPEPGGLRGL